MKSATGSLSVSSQPPPIKPPPHTRNTATDESLLGRQKHPPGANANRAGRGERRGPNEAHKQPDKIYETTMNKEKN